MNFNFKGKIMVKRIAATLLCTSALASGVVASNYDSSSLVGLELGGSGVNIEKTGGSYSHTLGLGNIGLKLGAESENYRIFINARYYHSNAFESFLTYGGELQYLINIHQNANIFVGVGTGIADVQRTKYGVRRELTDQYISGDLGVNIHLGEQFDLELGARMMRIDAESTNSTVTFNYNDLFTGYGSLIYKFHMD